MYPFQQPVMIKKLMRSDLIGRRKGVVVGQTEPQWQVTFSKARHHPKV